MFIDFLNIKNNLFVKENLIVFYGVSGGGKSTYLHYFMKNFKDHLFIFHKEEKVSYKNTSKKYIFIDEIVYFSQLFIIFRYLLSGKKIFIATHINLTFYSIIFIFFNTKLFSVDKNVVKITKYLENKNIKFSEKSLKYFLHKYKGSFIEIDFIIKHYSNINDFGLMLYLFEKECRLVIKNKF